RIAVGPRPATFAVDAVRSGGGTVVSVDERPEALVWLGHDMDALASVLSDAPDLRWIQLPSAGIERVVEAGLVDARFTWTCAKGAFAEPVAEHALTLALAGLRLLPERVEARSWGSQGGTSLYDERVTILGAGGITSSLLRHLAPFRVHTTVVRRSPNPMPGASVTASLAELGDALAGSLVVFLALALSPETAGVIGPSELGRMDEHAWLVNVARGRHVETDALVGALDRGSIAGAALDVTDPEPLPEGHPLWSLPNCIITPHTADTTEMVRPLLAERIRTNVVRYIAGDELVGLVDPEAGY
ncbi:MAG TPA: D-isomer specific 2-hydroxyacid dehydrogenase family protein, partial [Acidimicrobiales bacterium]|nr:D-isomer specific 2-hydroxyacid dehydrogenase family protein [Acidimicrobiales bacterium]